MLENYLLTIKCLSVDKYTSRKDIEEVYQSIVKRLKHAEWLTKSSFELDKQHLRWHMHTIVQTTKTPWFKRYQKKGWTIDFTLFPEAALKTVVSYINKDDQNRYYLEEQDWLSRSRRQYLFVD